MTRDEELKLLSLATTLPARVEQVAQRGHDHGNSLTALAMQVKGGFERLDEKLEGQAIALGRVETDSKARDTDLAHRLADLDGDVEDSKVHSRAVLEKALAEANARLSGERAAAKTRTTTWQGWLATLVIGIACGGTIELLRLWISKGK